MLPATNNTLVLFLELVCSITIYPITPRFIIKVRELYERDLHGRWQGNHTGLGVLSQTNVNGNTVVSTIVFADVSEQNQATEDHTDDVETIQLEVVVVGRHEGEDEGHGQEAALCVE